MKPLRVDFVSFAATSGGPRPISGIGYMQGLTASFRRNVRLGHYTDAAFDSQTTPTRDSVSGAVPLNTSISKPNPRTLREDTFTDSFESFDGTTEAIPSGHVSQQVRPGHHAHSPKADLRLER